MTAMNDCNFLDMAEFNAATCNSDNAVYRLQAFEASDNRLLNLCAEHLALLSTLGQQNNPTNLPELNQYLIHSITELHNRGLQADYSPRIMEKTCYILSAAFDEEIMNTVWGQAACWENHSLVGQLFQQRNAGEVFFLLLDQARQNAGKMIDFMELAYLLLCLGYRGQFKQSNGHVLTELMNRLYRDIRKGKEPLPVSDSKSCDKPTQQPWRPLPQYNHKPYLVIALILMLSCGLGCHLWIKHINSDYSSGLQQLSHWQSFNATKTTKEIKTNSLPSARNPPP